MITTIPTRMLQSRIKRLKALRDGDWQAEQEAMNELRELHREMETIEDEPRRDEDHPHRRVCVGCDGSGHGLTGCRCGVCGGTGLEPVDSLFALGVALSKGVRL